MTRPPAQTHETRKYTLIQLNEDEQKDGIYAQWKGLQHLARMQASRQTSGGTTHQTRY